MIQVILVDPHQAFREALASVLNAERDFLVVGQAATLDELERLLTWGEAFDLALVELDLGAPDGGETIRRIRAAHPHAGILALTGVTNRTRHARAVQQGVASIISKATTLGELEEAMRVVAAGGYVLNPAEMVDLIRLADQRRQEDRRVQDIIAQLTVRERQVLSVLADGLSDKEIAERLLVRPATVRTHLVNILGKLGVESRLAAVVFAMRHELVHVT